MNKLRVICDWDLEVDIQHHRPIELWVDRKPIGEKLPGMVQIGVLIEPPEIRSMLNVQNQIGAFDYILTHDQDLLNNHPNCFLYEFAGCWVRDYEETNKSFGVSTLIGGKQMTHGHRLREEVFRSSNRITIPKEFWISKNFPPQGDLGGNPILNGSKSEMFDRQFHICIENVKRENWFTEKLIDCLYTKTIPIYYGCPNIGDWFDERGFFIVNSTEEIIQACNKLTPETYNQMAGYVEKNYIEAMKYMNVGENIKRSIEKNILPKI
jgi:hypothetical protein